MNQPDRCIMLVGPMGAGKSTLGRRLAARLGMAFVDSDEEIEKAAGQSVSDIFARFGEAAFRDGERRVIARLIAGPPKVIATGGGAFVDAETRALALDRCIAIWIDADPETLVPRVSRRDDRPLLRGGDPLTVLRALAAARDPFYAEAHLRIRSVPEPRDHTTRRILDALAAWREESGRSASSV